MPYTIRAGTEGCHSLTLVVTHSFKGFDPTPADAAKDAAYAVWWVDVDDDPTAPTTLSRCSAAFPRDGGLSGGP
jgi:hypothetical protein